MARLLQLALAARADVLVSGDAGLAVLHGAVAPVKVMSASGLRTMLDPGAAPGPG